MLSFDAAIYHLRACQQRTLDFRTAVDYLQARGNSYQLLALFQQFFPQKFAESTASLYPTADDPEGHSERELAFLHLIDQSRFPLSDWTLTLAQSERLYELPILPMGVTLMADTIECLRAGLQILLPLSQLGRDYLEMDEGDEWYTAMFELEMATLPQPKTLPKAAFAQAAPPLCFLPLTLRVLDHRTGNLWLDVYDSEDSLCDRSNTLPWSVESIRTLQRHWRRYQTIDVKVTALLDWLEQDLTNHFQQLLELWQTR